MNLKRTPVFSDTFNHSTLLNGQSHQIAGISNTSGEMRFDTGVLDSVKMGYQRQHQQTLAKVETLSALNQQSAATDRATLSLIDQQLEAETTWAHLQRSTLLIERLTTAADAAGSESRGDAVMAQVLAGTGVYQAGLISGESTPAEVALSMQAFDQHTLRKLQDSDAFVQSVKTWLNSPAAGPDFIDPAVRNALSSVIDHFEREEMQIADRLPETLRNELSELLDALYLNKPANVADPDFVSENPNSFGYDGGTPELWLRKEADAIRERLRRNPVERMTAVTHYQRRASDDAYPATQAVANAIGEEHQPGLFKALYQKVKHRLLDLSQGAKALADIAQPFLNGSAILSAYVTGGLKGLIINKGKDLKDAIANVTGMSGKLDEAINTQMPFQPTDSAMYRRFQTHAGKRTAESDVAAAHFERLEQNALLNGKPEDAVQYANIRSNRVLMRQLYDETQDNVMKFIKTEAAYLSQGGPLTRLFAVLEGATAKRVGGLALNVAIAGLVLASADLVKDLASGVKDVWDAGVLNSVVDFVTHSQTTAQDVLSGKRSLFEAAQQVQGTQAEGKEGLLAGVNQFVELATASLLLVAKRWGSPNIKMAGALGQITNYENHSNYQMQRRIEHTHARLFNLISAQAEAMQAETGMEPTAGQYIAASEKGALFNGELARDLRMALGSDAANTLLAQYRRDDRSIQDLVDGLRDAMRLKGETKIAEHLTDVINDHPRFRPFDVPAQDLLDLGPDFNLYAFYQDSTGLKPEVLERIAGAEGVSILEDVFSLKQADILSAANSDPDGRVRVSIDLADVLPVVQRKMEVHVHQYNHVTVDDSIRDENQAIIETVKEMRERRLNAAPSLA